MTLCRRKRAGRPRADTPAVQHTTGQHAIANTSAITLYAARTRFTDIYTCLVALTAPSHFASRRLLRAQTPSFHREACPPSVCRALLHFHYIITCTALLAPCTRAWRA